MSSLEVVGLRVQCLAGQRPPTAPRRCPNSLTDEAAPHGCWLPQRRQDRCSSRSHRRVITDVPLLLQVAGTMQGCGCWEEDTLGPSEKSV